MSRSECSIEHDVQRIDSKICFFLDLLVAFKNQLNTFVLEHSPNRPCELRACPIHDCLMRVEPVMVNMCDALTSEFNKSDIALNSYRKLIANLDDTHQYYGNRFDDGYRPVNPMNGYANPYDQPHRYEQINVPDFHASVLRPSISFSGGRFDAQRTNDYSSVRPQTSTQAGLQIERPTSETAAVSSHHAQGGEVESSKKQMVSTPLVPPNLPRLSPSLLKDKQASSDLTKFDPTNKNSAQIELSSITIETSRMSQSVLTSIEEPSLLRPKEGLIKPAPPISETKRPPQQQPRADSPFPDKHRLLEEMPPLSPMSAAVPIRLQSPAKPPLPSTQAAKPAESQPDPIASDVCLTYKQQGLKFIHLTEHEKYKIYISHTKSPLIFWVHLQEYTSLLESLTKKINSFYSSHSRSKPFRLVKIHKDKYYAAKFSVDEKWYRARVLDLNPQENMALVYYVDYGNTETVSMSRLRLLANEFLKNEAFAIPLSLYQGMPIEAHKKQWNEEVKEYFQALLNNRSAEISIKYDDDWPLPFCKMKFKISKDKDIKTEHDAVKYLADHKLAQMKPSSEVVRDMINGVYAEYDFYNLGAFDTKRNGGSEENGNGGATPSQSDWGTKSQATRPVTDSVNESYKPKYQEKQHDFLHVFERKERNSSILMYKIEDLPKRYIKLDKKKQIAFEFSVTVNSPSSFYIYLRNDEHSQYQQLQKSLQAFYADKEAFLGEVCLENKYNFVFEDALCVCKSNISLRFARVRVVNSFSMPSKLVDFANKQVTVNLIDYATTETLAVTSLFPMFPDFNGLPAYAIHARLNLVEPTDAKLGWSHDAVHYFRGLINFEAFYLGIFHGFKPEEEFSIDMATVLALIVVYDETDSNLNDLLIDRGYARHILDDFEDEHFDEVPPAADELDVREIEMIEQELYDYENENLQLPPPPYPTQNTFYNHVQSREGIKQLLSEMDKCAKIDAFRDQRIRQYVDEQYALYCEHRKEIARKSRESVQTASSSQTTKPYSDYQLDSNKLEHSRTVSTQQTSIDPMSPVETRSSKKYHVSESTSNSNANLENGTVSMYSSKDVSSSKSIKKLLVNSRTLGVEHLPETDSEEVFSPQASLKHHQTLHRSHAELGASTLHGSTANADQTLTNAADLDTFSQPPVKDLNNNVASSVSTRKPSVVENENGPASVELFFKPQSSSQLEETSAKRLSESKSVNDAPPDRVRTSNYSALTNLVSSTGEREKSRPQNKPQETALDVLENWNPAKEQFESVKNSYGFNQANIEAHLRGYETKSVKNICYAQLRFGRCRRKHCPFLHPTITEEIVCSNNSKYGPDIAMKPFESIDLNNYDMILLEYVSFLGNNLFNGVVIGVFKNDKFIKTNRVQYLTKAMNNYYGGKKFLKDRSTYMIKGQLVAAQYKRTGNWYRAKIVKVHESLDLDTTDYELYFVDIGLYDRLNIRYVFPLFKHFLNYSYQTCHFTLADAGMSRLEFCRLVDRLNSPAEPASKHTRAVLNGLVVKTNRKQLELAITGYRLDQYGISPAAKQSTLT